MTPEDYISAQRRKAIANGWDPIEVERAMQAALDSCDGSMARLAQHMKTLQAIDEFEARVNRMRQNMVRLSSAPFRRIVTEEDRQDLLRGVVQQYPEQIRQLLEEIHPHD